MPLPSWLQWYKKPSYRDITEYANAVRDGKRDISPGRGSLNVPNRLSLERILRNETCELQHHPPSPPPPSSPPSHLPLSPCRQHEMLISHNRQSNVAVRLLHVPSLHRAVAREPRVLRVVRPSAPSVARARVCRGHGSMHESHFADIALRTGSSITSRTMARAAAPISSPSAPTSTTRTRRRQAARARRSTCTSRA